MLHKGVKPGRVMCHALGRAGLQGLCALAKGLSMCALAAHHPGSAKGDDVKSHIRPSFPVKLVKVLVLERLGQLHHPVCSEVEDHHCIPVLHIGQSCPRFLSSMAHFCEGQALRPHIQAVTAAWNPAASIQSQSVSLDFEWWQAITCTAPTGLSSSPVMTKAGTHWSDTGFPFVGFCTADYNRLQLLLPLFPSYFERRQHTGTVSCVCNHTGCISARHHIEAVMLGMCENLKLTSFTFSSLRASTGSL